MKYRRLHRHPQFFDVNPKNRVSYYLKIKVTRTKQSDDPVRLRSESQGMKQPAGPIDAVDAIQETLSIKNLASPMRSARS